MTKKEFKKIVYYDETAVDTYFEELYGGKKTKETELKYNVNYSVQISTSISVKLKLIFNILFKSEIKLDMSKFNNVKLLETNYSLFIKCFGELFDEMENVKLEWINNSATMFNFVIPMSSIQTNQFQNFDFDQFKSIIDESTGYYIFRENDNYYRFDKTLFKSNFKILDILNVPLNLYVKKISSYEEEKFDFVKEMMEMTKYLNNGNNINDEIVNFSSKRVELPEKEQINLYDVILASVYYEA